MSSANDNDPAEQLEYAEQLFRLITSGWISHAIHAAADLKLADLLHVKPLTSEELAARTGSHAPSLLRLLKALTTIDICREREDRRFEITRLGALLRSEGAVSLRAWALYSGGYQGQSWSRLIDCVRTGRSAREMISGTTGFGHLEQDSALAALFHEAMAEFTRLISQGIVRAYDFSSAARVVDLGGGRGELLAAVLHANPRPSGILFDLPHAVRDAKTLFKEKGIAQRCECIEGSFFESVPQGADLYMLKSVLHDWTDEQNRLILENCRRAMKTGGRLLIAERILPEILDTSPDHQTIARSDLTMMIGPGGRERTEREFGELLRSAGFRIARIIPVEMGYCLIEAKAAD